MSGTNIEYNGILFEDVLTEGWDQAVEYDSTGVDPLYIRVQLSFEVDVLKAGFNRGHSLDANDVNYAPSLAEVTRRLSMPRKRFVMTVGSGTLYDVGPGAVPAGDRTPLGTSTGNMDINNGPKTTFKVKEVIGDHSIKARFTVEIALPACDASGHSVGGVVSLRFWTGDDIDRNWKVQRVHQGRLRVAHRGISPHAFRLLVIPPLQNGFKRESIKLQEDENGLEFSFTITDVSQYAAAPAPATSWKMRDTLDSPQPGGAIFLRRVYLTLSAPTDVHKADLAQLAVEILENKLRLFRGLSNGEMMMQNASITDVCDEGTIEVAATIMYVAQDGGYNLLNMAGDTFAQPLTLAGYHPKRNVVRSEVPEGLAGIFLSALQTACSPAAGAGTASAPPAPQGTAAGAGTDTSVSYSQQPLQPYENKYSTEHRSAPFLAYRLTSEIQARPGNFALPTGASSTAGKTIASGKLHQGYARRVLKVRAERVGQAPTLPTPTEDFLDENGVRHTLLLWKLIANGSVLGSDGQSEIHHAEIMIEYTMHSVPVPGRDAIAVGRIPYISAGRVATSLPATMFQENIAT